MWNHYVLLPVLVMGSEPGPCSHKRRYHWATPPHPTCAPWSKSWWLYSWSKARFIFSYIQGSQYNVAPPTGTYVSFIFFKVLSFSVYMTSDCALCPSFLGNFIGPCSLCAHHCSSHHASCPHSRQLQNWWMPLSFTPISQLPISPPLLPLRILASQDLDKVSKVKWLTPRAREFFVVRTPTLVGYLILTVPSPYPLDTNSSHRQGTNLKCLQSPPNDCWDV